MRGQVNAARSSVSDAGTTYGSGETLLELGADSIVQVEEKMPLNPASPLARLLDAPMRRGRVQWIGVRPARKAPMQVLESAVFDPENGLKLDRYGGRYGQRQVTLIEAEGLAAIAAYLGLDNLDPALLRRNIVTAGINLLTLKGARLRLGPVILQVTGECQPCSRMEEILGIGGYNAVRGHGGLTARVIQGGTARVEDVVARVDGEVVEAGWQPQLDL